MPKQIAQPTRTGQMAGAQVKIMEVHNDALSEYVALVNRGALAQPMTGWALVTLRGERVYQFPDNLILQPGMMVFVHSGHDAPNRTQAPRDLFWTDEQMWNNRSDTAVLFDAHGLEVDRYAYPRGRMRGNTARHRQRLTRDGENWRVSDESAPEARLGQVRPRR
jgi:hypothetical protein